MNTMLKSEIVQFAKLIVEHVRDKAIRSCDVQLHTDNLNAPIARRWRQSKNEGDIDKLQEMIISDSVDDTIFYLFQAIDEGIINITLNSQGGELVNLTEDGLGEMSGWYMGEWRSTFTKERYSKDLEE